MTKKMNSLSHLLFKEIEWVLNLLMFIANFSNLGKGQNLHSLMKAQIQRKLKHKKANKTKVKHFLKRNALN